MWNVLTRLKLAYFQLAASQRIISVLAKNQQVVDQIEQGAEARYRVGEGMQQDVLRAQLERTKLLNELSMQRRESAQAQVVLKALLNRPADSPDLVPERPNLFERLWLGSRLPDRTLGWPELFHAQPPSLSATSFLRRFFLGMTDA